MVVSPADRRLAVEDGPPLLPKPNEPFAIRALAFPPAGAARCRYRIDGDEPRPMERRSARLWSAAARAPDRPFSLTVEVEDLEGARDSDTVEIAPAGSFAPASRVADGSDADAIGAWPDRGLLGTRLGPNRNGRKW